MSRRQTIHVIEYRWLIKDLLIEDVEKFPTFISSETFGLKGTSLKFCLQATINNFFDSKEKSKFFLRLRNVENDESKQITYTIKVLLKSGEVITQSKAHNESFNDAVLVFFPALKLKHSVLQDYLNIDEKLNANKLIVTCKITWQYRPDPRDKMPDSEGIVTLKRTRMSEAGYASIPGALIDYGNVQKMFHLNTYDWHYDLEAAIGRDYTDRPPIIWKFFVRNVRQKTVRCIVCDCSRKLKFSHTSNENLIRHLRKKHAAEYRTYQKLRIEINRGTRNYSDSDSEVSEMDYLSYSSSSSTENSDLDVKERRSEALKRRKRQKVSKNRNASPNKNNHGLSADTSKKPTNLKRRRTTSNVSFSLSDSDQPSTSSQHHQKRKKSQKRQRKSSEMSSKSEDQPSTSSKQKSSKHYRRCTFENSSEDEDARPKTVKRQNLKSKKKTIDFNTNVNIWENSPDPNIVNESPSSRSDDNNQKENSPTNELVDRLFTDERIQPSASKTIPKVKNQSQPIVVNNQDEPIPEVSNQDEPNGNNQDQPIPEVNNQDHQVSNPYSDITSDDNQNDENIRPNLESNPYSDITSDSSQERSPAQADVTHRNYTFAFRNRDFSSADEEEIANYHRAHPDGRNLVLEPDSSDLENETDEENPGDSQLVEENRMEQDAQQDGTQSVDELMENENQIEQNIQQQHERRRSIDALFDYESETAEGLSNQQNERLNVEAQTSNNQQSVANDHDYGVQSQQNNNDSKTSVSDDDNCSDSSSVIVLEEPIEVITLDDSSSSNSPSNEGQSNENKPVENQENNDVECIEPPTSNNNNQELDDDLDEEPNLRIEEPYKREVVTEPSTSQVENTTNTNNGRNLDLDEDSTLRIEEPYEREQITTDPPATTQSNNENTTNTNNNQEVDNDLDEEPNLRIAEPYKREQITTDLPPMTQSNEDVLTIYDSTSNSQNQQNENVVDLSDNSPYGIDQLRISSTTPTNDDSNNGPSINFLILHNPGIVSPSLPMSPITELNEKKNPHVSIQIDFNDKRSQSEPVSPTSQSSEESIDALVRRVTEKYGSSQNEASNDEQQQSNQQAFHHFYSQPTQTTRTLTEKEIFDLKNTLVFLLCEHQIPVEEVEKPSFMSYLQAANPNFTTKVTVKEVNQIIQNIFLKIQNATMQSLSKVKNFTLLINALHLDSPNSVFLFFSIGHQCGEKTEIIFLSVRKFMMQFGQQKQNIENIVTEVFNQFNLRFDQLLGTTILGFDEFLVENNFSPHLIYSHHMFIQRAMNEVFANDNTYLSSKFSLKMIVEQFCKNSNALSEFQHLTGINNLKVMEFEQLSACLLKNRHHFVNLCRQWFPETQIKSMNEREWSTLSEIQRLHMFCKEQLNPIIQSKHITIDTVFPLVKKFLSDLRTNFKLYLNDLPENLANKLEEFMNFAFNQNSPDFNPIYLKATSLNYELNRHLRKDQLTFCKRNFTFELKKVHDIGSRRKCSSLVTQYFNGLTSSHIYLPGTNNADEINLGYDPMPYWENSTEKFMEFAEIAKQMLPILATTLYSNEWLKLGLSNWKMYTNLNDLFILERNYYIHLNKHLVKF